MTRIAYVIDRLYGPHGGTERQLLILLKELDRSRFQPYLVCLHDTQWLRGRTLDHPMITYNVRRTFGVKFFLALVRFVRFCRRENIDIVQTFFSEANLFGVLGARLAGRSAIIASRRNVGHSISRRMLAILRVLARFTDCYLCNSEVAAQWAVDNEKLPSDKTRVIRNGLYPDEFRRLTPTVRAEQRRAFGCDENTLLVGMVANLRKVKNIALFLDVASLIAARYPDVRFVVAGEGPEEPQLRKKILDLSLGEVVSLPGPVLNRLPLLAALDIGVQCSISESLSNSIIEYMAAGIPCVVSDIAGNIEALDGVGGLLFRSGDKDDFFEKLQALVVDPDLRGRLGRQGQEYAFRNYDYRTPIRQHESLYQSLVQATTE